MNIIDIQNKFKIKKDNINKKLSKKRSSLKKKTNNFFLDRRDTELRVEKRDFFTYLRNVIKLDRNYYPNQLYIYYNKTPHNILHNIYLGYILYLFLNNIDYIININKYSNEIENKFKSIKKKDPDFNPKEMNLSNKLKETAKYIRIVYIIMFIYLLLLSYLIYYFMSYTLDLIMNSIINDKNYNSFRLLLVITWIIIAYIIYYFGLTIINRVIYSSIYIIGYIIYFIILLIITIITLFINLIIYLFKTIISGFKYLFSNEENKSTNINSSYIKDLFKNIYKKENESSKNESSKNESSKKENVINYLNKDNKEETEKDKDNNKLINTSTPILNLFKNLLKTETEKKNTNEESDNKCKSNILENFFIKFNKTKFDKDDESISRCITEKKENKYEKSLKCK